jgi:hypothetical protein
MLIAHLSRKAATVDGNSEVPGPGADIGRLDAVNLDRLISAGALSKT